MRGRNNREEKEKGVRKIGGREKRKKWRERELTCYFLGVCFVPRSCVHHVHCVGCSLEDREVKCSVVECCVV